MGNKTDSGYIVILKLNADLCAGMEDMLGGVDELTAPTMALIAHADNPREFSEMANIYSPMPLKLFGCARCDKETFNKLIEELGTVRSHENWYSPYALFWRQMDEGMTIEEAYTKALDLVLDLDIQGIRELHKL